MATVQRLPYSESLFKHISQISNWYSPLFCTIRSFSNTPFEIRLDTTPFPDRPPDRLDRLEPGQIEKLYLQCMALFKMARDRQWTFIDFSRFHLRPGFLPLFPLCLLKQENIIDCALSVHPPRELLERFREHAGFNSLKRENWEDVFLGLNKTHGFEESDVHVYRMDELASAILNAYPLEELDRDTNLKININTAGDFQRTMVRDYIIAHQVSDTVCLASINGDGTTGNVLQNLAHLVNAPAAFQTGDYVSLIENLERFMAQSDFNSILLMVETPGRSDAEFIDFLVNDSGIRGIRLICLDAPGALRFDLELNERPDNLIGKYLRIGAPGQDYSHTLQKAADITSSRFAELLKGGHWDELKNWLKKQKRRKQAPGVFVPDIQSLLHPIVEILKTDKDLAGLLVNLLADAGDFVSAQFLLERTGFMEPANHPGLPSLLILGIGRVYLEMKDYKSLRSVLSGLKVENPADEDIYLYLSFTLHHRESDHEKAQALRKQIDSAIYAHRAELEMCDRSIYQGDYEGAQNGLKKALAFFSQYGYEKDEIETLILRAKLLREKGDYGEAEKLYKNLLIRARMKPFQLLSARLCVDLGNLFHRRDDFKTAETWYRRALKRFDSQNNRNGILLASFNLSHTDRANGNWRETGRFLEEILKADGEAGSKAAMAIDYYNIAHLEYLKLRMDRCREFVETAIHLFKEQRHFNPLVECELLKLKARLADGENETANRGVLADLKTFCSQTVLGKNQRAEVSVMETVFSDSSGKRASTALEKIVLMESPSKQFELLAALIHRYRDTVMLAHLKELSMVLSPSHKNYYYYEYFYLYYAYFFKTTEITSEESRRFGDMYYFFLENQRHMSAATETVKEEIERRESSREVFKSARMVGEYKRWKIPEDFFNSLVEELKKLAPVELVRLIVFAGQQNDGEAMFDFTSRSGAASGFECLTRELIEDAIVSLEHLNLSADDIRERCTCDERAFYSFGCTRVILWKISSQLFAGLLLAFKDTDQKSIDIYSRHQSFFQKFGALIREFVEGDYKINRKLAFLIGESAAMKRLKERILKVAKVDFSVLIRGESGAGKELVAKGVHLLSRRSAGPFVPVNAAAIPENLLEAEFFGYRKGAFTGADESKTGLIQAAHRGTLFLDEVADLPLNLQAKMLRVLQEGEIRRLGENKTLAVDVRLITATNKNLKAMIETGTFREDLFFRLQDLIIDVPPLRNRAEDIPLLAGHFLRKYNFQITGNEELQRICTSFQARHWSGNVRELESAVKRFITFYPDFEEDMDMSDETDNGLIAVRNRMERNLLCAALNESGGNKAQAARSLKITRQYLFKLIQKHQLENI